MTIEAENYLPKRVKLISLGDAGAGKSAIIKVIIKIDKSTNKLCDINDICILSFDFDR